MRSVDPRGASRSGVADSTLTPAATAAYRRAEGSHTAHARQRGHCERANAELKSWKVLRKIRSSPSRGTVLVQAAKTLMIIG
jgi:hypothetical protein